MIETLQQFSGPIPPPHFLREYDELISNGAERIFAQFEGQTAHRQAIEKAVITNGIRQQRLGQLMAFTLGVLGLALAGLMVWRGEPGYAVSVFTADVATLCGAFLYGRRVQERERVAKFTAGG